MNRNQEDGKSKLKMHSVLWRMGAKYAKCSTNMVLLGDYGELLDPSHSKQLVQMCRAAVCHWPPWRRGWRWRLGGCTCRQTWGRLRPWWPSPWWCPPADRSAAAHHSVLWSPRLLLYRGDDGTDMSDTSHSYRLKATVCRISKCCIRKTSDKQQYTLPARGHLRWMGYKRHIHADIFTCLTCAIRII